MRFDITVPVLWRVDLLSFFTVSTWYLVCRLKIKQTQLAACGTVSKNRAFVGTLVRLMGGRMLLFLERCKHKLY